MNINVNDLTNEQLAGQRLMIGFYGTELTQELAYHICHHHIGGVILFKRNLIEPLQIKELCSSIQELATSSGNPSLLIAVDQEGGKVARLTEPFFTKFAGNPFIKEYGDAVEFATITAKELKSVGITMNLAPVLDVVPEGVHGIMSERVFGTDPYQVAELGQVVIETMQNNGILATAKHFPGIGRTIDDSHIDLPVLSNVTISELESFDLIPFYAAIRSQVSTIMLAHIRYDSIDPIYPASLSTQIAKHLLRDHMGFDGVVITDDLDMGAIKKHFDLKTIIRKILEADIDIALICHSNSDVNLAFEEIIYNYEQSSELRTHAEKSWHRIQKIKQIAQR